jgi:hypothetical protein
VLLDLVPPDGWAPPDAPAAGLYRWAGGERQSWKELAPAVTEAVAGIAVADGRSDILLERDGRRVLRTRGVDGAVTEQPVPDPEPRRDGVTWSATALGGGRVGFVATELDLSGGDIAYTVRVVPPDRPAVGLPGPFRVPPVVTWSGETVYFTRPGESGPVTDCAWRQPLAGGEPTRLWCYDREGATKGTIQTFVVTRDGRFAAIVGDAVSSELLVGSADAPRSVRLLPGHDAPQRQAVRQVVWSPDGAWLAVLANVDGPCWGDRVDAACTDTLYVVAADGAVTTLLGPQAGGGRIAWGR